MATAIIEHHLSDNLREFRIAVQDAASAVISGNWTLESFYNCKLSPAVQHEFSFLTFARLVGKRCTSMRGAHEQNTRCHPPFLPQRCGECIA
jgi:hypothetical protein